MLCAALRRAKAWRKTVLTVAACRLSFTLQKLHQPKPPSRGAPAQIMLFFLPFGLLRVDFREKSIIWRLGNDRQKDKIGENNRP